MTQQTKIKYKNLTQADREVIRCTFRDPLMTAAQSKLEADRIQVGDQIAARMFTPEQKAALTVLRKAGWLGLHDSAMITTGAKSGYQTIHFSSRPLPCPYTKYVVSAEDLEASRVPRATYEAEIARIESLMRELNSVLLTCKTRRKLGEVWPPIYDLMGADWVDAQDEPSTLPAVMTAGITAAVAQFKKAA